MQWMRRRDRKFSVKNTENIRIKKKEKEEIRRWCERERERVKMDS